MMLDTVALKIPLHHFKIQDVSAFVPSAALILEARNHPVRGQAQKCVCNPTRKQAEAWGYLPRMTLWKRPDRGILDIFLRVEFSAPKMLHGNNFDELTEADFPKVLARLAEQMGHMGVRVTQQALRDALVLAIHYSKNMPLTDYTSCSMVIEELAKCAVTRRLDTVQTHYWNDGSAVRHHASSFEVIVYDKLKDLAKGRISDKRAIERDSGLQLDLIKMEFQRPFEVLRLEVRLGNRAKLKRLLAQLALPDALTFQGLFREATAKAVLLHYWKEMTADMPILACSQFMPEELYQHFRRNEPDKKMAKLLQRVGQLAIVRNIGMSGLRSLIMDRQQPRGWYRMKQELEEIPLMGKLKYSAIQVAGGHLAEFVPLRMRDYICSETKLDNRVYGKTPLNGSYE